MTDAGPVVSLDALVAQVRDGDQMSVATGFHAAYSGVAMDATRALIRRGVRKLRLLCVPSSSLQADLLIGAGCLASIEMGAALLYEYGPAPRFVAAQRAGSIQVREATCPAIAAGLRAGEAGLPFLPVRGVLGSDVFRVRSNEWKEIDNPFQPGERIVVIPAIRPDVALFHAPLADSHGNVWIGTRGTIRLMAHAAHRVLATFDALYPGNLLDDADKAPGTLASTYVTALCHRPGGSWPLHGGPASPEDADHMRLYAKLAKTDAGFNEYLERHMFAQGAR
ncbi:MAG TPA: CoA-transferase [Ramlibacter sp.]|nr:CoA-transferase [Ramlibacter sp.]